MIKSLATRMLPAVVLALAILVMPPLVFHAHAEGTVLKNRIIRALFVDPSDPDHILVGNKANKPGSGLVFQSRDGGATWKTLNAGKPLSPKAADVQSVAAIGTQTIIAGTWKHGLYVSHDGGKNFNRVDDFPSRDIRDLQLAKVKDSTILYAATARHGVFHSSDAGRTWSPIGPGKDFFWSLTTAARHKLYAVSLEKAIYCRCGKDADWRKIFDAENAYGIAATGASNVIAVAAETGAHLSGDGGRSWLKINELNGEKLSDAIFLPSDPSGVLFASWANGLILADKGSGTIKQRLLPGVPIVHVVVSGDKLLAGTWGKGLKVLPLSTVTP